ncbi:MAG: tRNA dihydrouridine(20/20a) synthase DusA [Pseudomonadota bacterium]
MQLPFSSPSHRLCTAPMMDWTDRHARYFFRLFSPKLWVYTEMVTTGALLYGGNPNRFLNYSVEEHPIALQLGGNQPELLAECAKMAEAWNYDEVNLNLGCPSPRVSSGSFGACLMRERTLVAECVKTMSEACGLPITVKCRLGIDYDDDYEFLAQLVEEVGKAGCHTWIIHARKAWLTGLNPKQNRDIPPLDYERVYRLKRDFPQYQIIVNGGIQTLEEGLRHIEQCDGIMLGRAAYQNSSILLDADNFCEDRFETRLSSNDFLNERYAIAKTYGSYLEQQLKLGVAFRTITRPVLSLFNGCSGARVFRRTLSDFSGTPTHAQALDLWHQALAKMVNPD